MPPWSSLNENSFCKTEKENLLIYSLTISENYKETKVKAKSLKVHLKLKYSHVRKKSWSMVWICLLFLCEIFMSSCVICLVIAGEIFLLQ